MIDESTGVYRYGEHGPDEGSDECWHWYIDPEPQPKHPDIDVASTTNEPKSAIKLSQFVKLLTEKDMPQVIEQIIAQIADHQPSADPPDLLSASAGDQKDGDGQIPGVFDEKVEHMLQLSKTRGLQFRAG